MAAPYCVHLDNFVNFTSVLGYFILNSHVRIGSPSYFDNTTRAKILRLDGFFVIYSYSKI